MGPLLVCRQERKNYMDKIVVEKEVVVRDGGGDSTGSNAVWAIALVIIVALIAGVLYYSGTLRRLANQGAQKINVDVSVPAAPAAPAPAAPR